MRKICRHSGVFLLKGEIMRKVSKLAVMLLFCLSYSFGGERVENLLTVSDSGAWCWFQDPRAVYHKGKSEKSYIGWIDKHGSVGVSSYNHTTKSIRKTILHEKLQRDDHDNPAIIVRPDGRLVIFYTSHSWAKHPMYYRISKYPEDISEFGPEQKITTNTKGNRGWCYPNPVQLSAENNRIYLFWRGANWKPTFSYTDDLKTWSKAQTLVQEDGRESGYIRPYVKISSNGVDSFQVAFTDGHPRDEKQNSIYYARYKGGKFYKADGTLIGSMDKLPLKHSQTDVVYDAKKTNVRGWVWDVAADKKGNPVVVYTRLPSEKDHRYHYARWNGKKWIDHEISAGGKWFPQTAKGKREREPHYSGGVILDHKNVNDVYFSKPVKGVFEIFKGATNNLGKSWELSAVTSGSKYDNVRPFVIRNTPAEVKPNLTWMSNKKYTHYTKYDSTLKVNIPQPKFSAELDPEAMKHIMRKVTDWQLVHPKHHPLDWTNGAMWTGMTKWALFSGEKKYLDAVYQLGENHNWGHLPRKYHADDHAISMAYIDFYQKYRENKMINPTIKLGDWLLKNPAGTDLKFGTRRCLDRWSWCDALFMSPTVWTKLSAITGDNKYLKWSDKEFWATTDYLYDKEEKLFYRDSRYFDKKTSNGQKVFWGRGNGWVFGGLAIILEDMPKDWPTRPKYEKLYKEMAKKLKDIQAKDGYWRASLLDFAEYPAPETSCTGFFTYGLAWGINHGYLPKNEYMPAVKKGWEALVDAVEPNGKLGWVQPIGADPRKAVRAMTEVYGVGAFLLAGSEIAKMSLLESGKRFCVKNLSKTEVTQKMIAIKIDTKVADLQVMDLATGQLLVSQCIDNDQDGTFDELIFQTNLYPGQNKPFVLLENYPKKNDVTCFGRHVPERADDFAWENDKVAFRMYGPSLEKKDGRASGIDIWSKRVDYPIINKWYKNGHYHSDHGEGADFYKVGPSRGCGGLGYMVDGKMETSGNWIKSKVITTGPLRVMFELTYAPVKVGNQMITETKRISLDRGSYFNKCVSKFKSSSEFEVAVGVVRRGNAGAMSYDNSADWMTYQEPPMKKGNGTIVSGVIFPGANNFEDKLNHGLLSKKVSKSGTVTYYAGAGWSKAGFEQISDWQQVVVDKAKSLKQSIKVEVK